METLLFMLKFIGGLILLFVFGYFIGTILKLHKYYFGKRQK